MSVTSQLIKLKTIMIEYISQPWHWSVSGVMIAFVMFLMIYFGKQFGVSSSFKAICSAGGAGKLADYFDYNWKSHGWLLVFVVGAILGGFLASNYLQSSVPVALSQATINDLNAMGISAPKAGALVPPELFSIESLSSVRSLLVLIVGGIFIGFGTRYAGGCTSGHAITGLANLQLPSLVAVIGFFIGGLLSTHLLLSFIMSI